MPAEILEEVASSKARLGIADLLSARPRTLKELADITGISVQGVLKHLEKLEKLGLVSERKISGGGFAVRKLYATKGTRIGDFSIGDLTVVKLSRRGPQRVVSADPVKEVESIAESAMVQKRRIRDQVRKLGRMIEELVEDRARMEGLIASLDLNDEERLLVQTAFSEESLEDAERVLREHHDLRDARRSLERALGKARRVGKK